MTKEPETGTLAELNVKPGDVVRHSDGSTHEVRLNDGEPALWWLTKDGDEKSSRGWGVYVSASFQTYTIVSRAPQPDTPKLWRDMTPEEKGALLLAAYEKRPLQSSKDGVKWVGCLWFGDDYYYRTRPEPKRETARVVWTPRAKAFHGAEAEIGDWVLTFEIEQTEDGPRPVQDTVKFEEHY